MMGVMRATQTGGGGRQREARQKEAAADKKVLEALEDINGRMDAAAGV